jgi:hypothetical protein
MTDISIHDLEACGDVFDWLCENADGLSADNAIPLLEAAQQLQQKLKLAIDMLKAQALSGIEQPILVGSVAWSKKPSIKYRPDQTKIAKAVVAVAIEPDHDTGEMRDAETAAERAVRLMQTLYVSPSTVPKVGGVENLGLTMKDVTREDRTGWELKRTELE